MFSQNILLNKDQTTINEFREELSKLGKNIMDEDEEMFNLFEEEINSQLELIKLCSIVCRFKGDFIKSQLNEVFKNITTIMGILCLYEQGHIGSAEMLFRNVYEGLVIYKYIAVFKDFDLYSKWENGKQINLKKDVFSKLFKKPSVESVEFWDFLNKYTHATIYSQDNILECSDSRRSNFYSILTVLVEMNYNFFNSFVLSAYNYYLKYYFSDVYALEKNKIREMLKKMTKMVDERCKKVIKEYKSRWNEK